MIKRWMESKTNLENEEELVRREQAKNHQELSSKSLNMLQSYLVRKVVRKVRITHPTLKTKIWVKYNFKRKSSLWRKKIKEAVAIKSLKSTLETRMAISYPFKILINSKMSTCHKEKSFTRCLKRKKLKEH